MSGEKRFIAFGAAATVVIASVTLDGKPCLVAIPSAALEGRIKASTCVDETQRLCCIDLNGVEITATDLLDGADPVALVRAATLLQTAEMCGGVAGALEDTLEYLKNRKQFGRLIGAYQSLKHTMSDIWVQYELLRSLVYAAASNLQSNKADFLVSMAKAKASELFVHVGDRSVQFHGGFGFTYDCDAGFYLRRAIWTGSQFGSAVHHRKRLAATLLDGERAGA